MEKFKPGQVKTKTLWPSSVNLGFDDQRILAEKSKKIKKHALRWLATVSNTFQDLDFDWSL